MKYVQPFDQPSNPTAPYVDQNEAMGVDGSVPPAKFFNHIQAEVLNLITGAGLTPTDTEDDQLYQAVLALMPTVSGAPSESSLVHWATDSGTANSLILSPTPIVTSIAAGFTVFFIPANSITGPSTITVNLSGGGTFSGPLRRQDNTNTRNGDAPAGRLAAAVHDGTRFRLAIPPTFIVTDGKTIAGEGTATDPLRTIVTPAGPGVAVGQFITITVAIYASSPGFTALYSPSDAGFLIDKIYTAAELTSGVFSGTNSYFLGATTPNGSNTGWFAAYASPLCAVAGTIVGKWRLQMWNQSDSGVGVTAFHLTFVRTE